MTENKSGGDRSADSGRAQPSTNTPSGNRVEGGHVHLSNDQKGIVVMPTSTATVDVQNLAPSGPPPPQQAAPADTSSPSSSSSSDS